MEPYTTRIMENKLARRVYRSTQIQGKTKILVTERFFKQRSIPDSIRPFSASGVGDKGRMSHAGSEFCEL